MGLLLTAGKNQTLNESLGQHRSKFITYIFIPSLRQKVKEKYKEGGRLKRRLSSNLPPFLYVSHAMQ